MKLLLVAGARPNFMKIAPIIRELGVNNYCRVSSVEFLHDFTGHGALHRAGNEHKWNSEKLNSMAVDQASCIPQVIHKVKDITWRLVHTGQHYDYEMSEVFFNDLDIPGPDSFLHAGSGTHAEQTAKIMVEFEKVCLEEKPDMVVVVGDVNSTLACSITAKKLHIKIAHVEAGLRSGDMLMPEEVNRVVTDSISDYLFVTERRGMENLKREGKSPDAIFFVGHIMVDNLFYQLNRLNGCNYETESLKDKLGNYLFLTLHRPSNVDNYEIFKRIVDGLNEIADEIPIIFPIHPRTWERLDHFGLVFSDKIVLLKPLNFSEALYLWKDAIAVLTDSGGLQEETTALGIPCLTLRKNTERPITVEIGTNSIVGSNMEKLKEYVSDIFKGHYKKGQLPEKWDGKAAKRIVKTLQDLHFR